MKPLLILLLMGILRMSVSAQITPEWAVTYSPGILPSMNGVNQIINDDQGNSYITAYGSDTSFTSHTSIFKYNTLGILQWQAQYDTTNYFSKIDIDPVKNVFVAGSKIINGIPRIYLVKYDSSGSFLWERFYGTSNISYGFDITVDDSGNAVVSGISNSNFHTILKYNGVGNLLWWASDSIVNGNAKTFVALDEFGDIYHTVRGWDILNLSYTATVYKYKSSGDKLWEFSYPGNFPQGSAIPVGMVYKNGYLYLPTFNTDFSDAGFAAVKYDTSGNFQWEYVYDKTTADEQTFGLDVDDSGNVYIIGYLYPYSCSNDSILTIRLDANGNSIWEKVIGSNDCGFDKPYDIEVDDQGYIYVGAEIPGSNNPSEFLTVKYDSSGTELWRATYTSNVPYGDIPHSLSTDPSGNVYISGVSNNDTTDILTLKYSFTTSQDEITDPSRKFLLYPNPFSDHLFIESESHTGDFHLRLLDITGREVYNSYFGLDNSAVIDLSVIETGIYMYEISDMYFPVQQGKIIAQ